MDILNCFLSSVRCSPAFAWMDRSGRGFNPRPAREGKLHPRQISLCDFKSGRASFRNGSFNCFLSSIRCSSAFAWMDRSGRGFNPRPAREGKLHPRQISLCDFKSGRASFRNGSFKLFSAFCPLLLCFRVDGSFRSGVQPPTGAGGKAPPPPNISRNSKSGKTFPKMNLFIDFYFPSAAPLFSRGWIVPVGGSTPDRHFPTGTKTTDISRPTRGDG